MRKIRLKSAWARGVNWRQDDSHVLLHPGHRSKLITFRNQFLEDRHARHNITAIVVSGRGFVAVTALRTGYGPIHAAVVTAGGNLSSC